MNSESGGAQNVVGRVPFDAYYGEYHGHLEQHLSAVYECVAHDAGGSNALRKATTQQSLEQPLRRRRVIWFAGDSTLDNKYWVPRNKKEAAEALNGYERVLQPPRMARDVCFHLNRLLVERALDREWCAINAAVEGSTVSERDDGQLLAQDAFLRDHLDSRDVVVLSIGGNDIALRPTFRTICSMLALVWFNSLGKLLNTPSRALGMPRMRELFQAQTEKLLRALVIRCASSNINDDAFSAKLTRAVVCMLYFPDEAQERSWAALALRALRYNSRPELLQAAIRAVFKVATQQVVVPSSDGRGGNLVRALAMFEVLDGKDTGDYVARVEPSDVGGAKLAQQIFDALSDDLQSRGGD
mmetsp:Transcript_4027/g.11077  ORF Transcript_4027/g.11077 Transcript_4027/m.11077 type:complete len:356 (-) Transcript_4027:2751-3818(-)